MPRFRKIPVEIEAVQFDGMNDPEGVWRREEDLVPYVVTIHGQRCYIEAGDWIVPEPDGVHFYPVKPGVFNATYKPVRSSSGGTTNPDNAGWIKRVKQTTSFEEMAIVLREWLATIEAMKIDHINKPKG